MNARTMFLTVCLGLGLSCPFGLANDQRPNPEFAKKASWAAPKLDAVREQVFAYLATVQPSESVRTEAEALWQTSALPEAPAVETPAAAEPAVPATPPALPLEKSPATLDNVAATLALVDPRVRELVAVCSQPRAQVVLPESAWLTDEATPAFARHNLRLHYARWLVHESLYDEAQEQLKDLKTEEVVDPAALLFYQAVVQHRALQRDAGLASITRLMENEAALPKRYASVARLMQADLDGLKDESLDHIARRMEDIRRRLDLGRAGPKVREVEDGVIASLDKIIEELEKRQQSSSSSGSGSSPQGGQQPNSNPSPGSAPPGSPPDERVKKNPATDPSGWADLPPKQRDEALQQIGKEYPAHYRDMIEGFFRKLATEGDNTPK